MNKEHIISMKGSVIPTALVASVFIGVIALLGVGATSTSSVAHMNMYPSGANLTIGESFPVKISVGSKVPTNVFSGEVNFNHEVLQIESISYNTSVANLWAEKPWYDNGEGTVSFAGGTTQSGGFTGDKELITIYFKTIQNGEGVISLQKQRVLLHDGLGTDATVPNTIDTIISVEQETPNSTSNLVTQAAVQTNYRVTQEGTPSTDLNQDGKQTMADISIFMMNLAGTDDMYDFNQDGKVNLKDLNIVMGAE